MNLTFDVERLLLPVSVDLQDTLSRVFSESGKWTPMIQSVVFFFRDVAYSPESGGDHPVDEPSFVNVSENIISESPNSNLGLKKILDLKASKIAALNPDAEVRFMSEPIRKIGETRPFAVTHYIIHYIVKDGEIIDAVSVLNK